MTQEQVVDLLRAVAIDAFGVPIEDSEELVNSVLDDLWDDEMDLDLSREIVRALRDRAGGE